MNKGKSQIHKQKWQYVRTIEHSGVMFYLPLGLSCSAESHSVSGKAISGAAPPWSLLIISAFLCTCGYGCGGRQLLVKTSNPGDLSHQTHNWLGPQLQQLHPQRRLLIWVWLSFLRYSFPFPQEKRIPTLGRHVLSATPEGTSLWHRWGQHSASGQQCAPLNLMKSIVKYRHLQTSMVHDVQTQRSTVFSFLLLYLL